MKTTLKTELKALVQILWYLTKISAGIALAWFAIVVFWAVAY